MTTEHHAIRLPARDAKGHKGTFGAVAIVGGCAHNANNEHNPDDGVRMIGGPALAALAALRTGAGLAKLVMPEPVLNAGLIIAPSATGISLKTGEYQRIIAHLAAQTLDRLLPDVRALVVGPGLGVGDAEQALSLRAVQQEETPVVIDADALNNLAQVPELWRDFRAQAILTPHPGEYARLADSLNISINCGADPESAAAELARRLGCVVVLKGARTVVSDGQQLWSHEGDNPALATGGSGDVLAGIIGGLLAQHYRTPLVAGSRSIPSQGMGGLGLLDAACAGVTIHARAAAAWCAAHGQRTVTGGMLATDLLDLIPGVVESMRVRA